MSRDFDWAASMEQRERDSSIARAQAAVAARGGSGICEDCGAAIPAARLQRLPNAIRCVGCQTDYEQGRR